MELLEVLPSAEGSDLVLHIHRSLVKLLEPLEKDKKGTFGAVAQPPFQRAAQRTAGDTLLEQARSMYWSSKHLLNIF